MGKLQERITAKQTEVTAAKAEASPDQAKIARLEGELAMLRNLDNEGLGHSQTDIDAAVTGRLPDAQTSAKEAERKATAQSLGVPVEKLDEELQRLKGIRDNQQSETDRERQAREAAEGQVTALQTSEQKAKRTAETVRKQLEDTLKRQAVERALLGEGVVHQTGDEAKSYLDGAYRLTDLSAVSVEVEVDDEGNLKVKGETKGADTAAKKTKEEYPAMFGEVHQQVQNPRRTPAGSGSGGGGGSAYKPNYSVTGQRAT